MASFSFDKCWFPLPIINACSFQSQAAARVSAGFGRHGVDYSIDDTDDGCLDVEGNDVRRQRSFGGRVSTCCTSSLWTNAQDHWRRCCDGGGLEAQAVSALWESEFQWTSPALGWTVSVSCDGRRCCGEVAGIPGWGAADLLLGRWSWSPWPRLRLNAGAPLRGLGGSPWSQSDLAVPLQSQGALAPLVFQDVLSNRDAPHCNGAGTRPGRDGRHSADDWTGCHFEEETSLRQLSCAFLCAFDGDHSETPRSFEFVHFNV